MFKFKVDIFNETPWQKFTQLSGIRPLPLNEQVKKYNQYISELTYERNVYLHWLEGHKKGHKKGDKKKTLQNVGFLLQEDGFDILQEDNNKIIIT